MALLHIKKQATYATKGEKKRQTKIPKAKEQCSCDHPVSDDAKIYEITVAFNIKRLYKNMKRGVSIDNA